MKLMNIKTVGLLTETNLMQILRISFGTFSRDIELITMIYIKSVDFVYFLKTTTY